MSRSSRPTRLLLVIHRHLRVHKCSRDGLLVSGGEMTDGRWWRALGGPLVAVVVRGSQAGCSGAAGAGSPAAAASASAAAKASRLSSEQKPRGALLTRVNGVAAAAPGEHRATMAVTSAASAANVGGSARRGRPGGRRKACAAGAAENGFELCGAARRGGRRRHLQCGQEPGLRGAHLVVRRFLATARARRARPGRVRRGTSGRWQGQGPSSSSLVSQSAVTGIGRQARAARTCPGRAARRQVDQWSLIYRGAGFVGTVTVVGPNASEQAVQELAEQAYAFAAKTLS